VADDGLDDRFDGPLDAVETGSRWLGTASSVIGLGAAIPGVNTLATPAAIVLGTAATVGTAVLWANDRASRGDVAASAVSPAAGLTAKGLRLLDAVVPDEAVPARRSAPAPVRPTVPSRPAPAPARPATASASTSAPRPRPRAAEDAEGIGLAADVQGTKTAVEDWRARR
jgi:hypothetical protein